MAPSRPCVPAPPPAASSRGRCPRPNPDAANSSYRQRGPGLSCRLEEAPEVIRRSLSTSTCVRKVGRLFFLLFTRCPERDRETAAAGPRAWTVVQAPVCPRRRRCVNKRPASPHGAAHTGSFRPRPDPPAGRETRVFAPPRKDLHKLLKGGHSFPESVAETRTRGAAGLDPSAEQGAAISCSF